MLPVPDRPWEHDCPVNIRIVPFQAAHTQAVIDLSLRAWAPVFDKLKPAVPSYVYRAFYPEGWATRQEADIRALLRTEAANVWIADDRGLVVGWVGLRIHSEDAMGEIHIIAVDPDHQGRGVGGRLIEHGLSLMRGAGLQIAMVETGDDPGHESSRATYERAGFERWPVARYFRRL